MKPTNQAAKPIKKKSWIVAVDPFAGADFQRLWNLLNPLAERSAAVVQATYVLAPSSMNWTGEFSGPWIKKYKTIAEEKLTEVLPAGITKRTIVPCKESGLRAAVKTLLQFAKKEKADCLVISTHARKGLERLAMGSFAETLILTSKIPVLVINPANKVPQQVSKILVPTDLSKKSERFIGAIADYARTLNAGIVLYYKQPDPLDPIIQQGVYSLGGGWVSTESFMDKEIEQKKEQIEKMENIVRARGVQVSSVIDSSSGELISSIDKAAKDRGADMISVLTQSGSWSAALLGSVARGLVRNASVPVLVRR